MAHTCSNDMVHICSNDMVSYICVLTIHECSNDMVSYIHVLTIHGLAGETAQDLAERCSHTVLTNTRIRQESVSVTYMF